MPDASQIRCPNLLCPGTIAAPPLAPGEATELLCPECGAKVTVIAHPAAAPGEGER